ncbi:uncharacterized protein LOC144552555 [Carex rostrata]
MEGMISPEMADILTKATVFLLVQVLVYLILAKSSNIFSENSPMRSLSFRPARSASIRRFLAYFSDAPMDGDDASSASSPTYYQLEKSASPKTM